MNKLCPQVYTGTPVRGSVVLTLCAILLTSTIAPVFAQKRTAVRVSPSEAGRPTLPRKRESEEERERRQAAARRAGKAQEQGRLYTPVSSQGPTTGLPSVGEAGVEKATSEIMVQQAKTPETSRPPRLSAEREGPNRRGLPQDPESPLVSSIGGDVTVSEEAPVRGRRGVTTTQPSAAAQAVVEPSAPQTISPINFTGATLADTGAFPPDTMGAVGPTQFFVFVNGRLRTFNKSTGIADSVINADADVFFSSVMTPVPGGGLNFTSDPNVRYDRATQRWFLTIIDVPSSSPSSIGDIPNRLLIAVSDAASAGVISASTVWTFYYVQQDTIGGPSTGEFLDYPSLGIDNNALYVGGNMFGAVSGSFVACSVFVIRKSSLLSGGPVVTTAFRGVLPNGTSEGPFAPRGVDNNDPAATEGYIVGVSNAAFGRLILRRIANPGGTPTISGDIPITVPSTTFPITVDHLGDTGGTNGNLDALDDRLYAAVIRNGKLWTSHNIAVNSSGVAAGSAQRRDAVRWYELTVPPTSGTPTINQSGTIFDSAATVATARQFWIPSVTVSGQGHAAFGFSTAGTPFPIDAATSGRLRTNTLGTTGAVALYTASSTAYNPPSDPGPIRRFGDYSFTSVDPDDDMTMWTIQQFCNAANTYAVRVVKLIAPPPATPSVASPATVPTGSPSVNVTITGTSVSGSEFFDPGAGFPKHISATVTGGVTVNSVTYTDPTHVTLNISTVGATSGAQNVTIKNPDGQTASGTGIITLNTPAPAATTGQVLIKEFRFHGAAGAGDEFVELFNNTNGPVDISGFTLHALTAAGTQSLRYTVPGALGSSTTVIPARGHYLITGASYSLSAVASSNGALSADIVDGSAIGLFAGATPSALTRIDSAGFDNRDSLFFEGTPVSPGGAGTGGITTNGEYSFVRRLATGFPQDTGNNDADFVFVSTTGGTFSTRASILGGPGPENLAGPRVRDSGSEIQSRFIDPAVAATVAPNRVRTQRASCPTCDNTKSNFGTMEVRRKFVNLTGAAVTRLRFRVVDVTTLNNQLVGDADMRTLSASGNFSVVTSGGSVTVQSLTLEAPSDAVTNGGGLNSTLSAGTITLGTPLANGDSINVNFLLGVQQSGNFRFIVHVEAVP